MLVNSLIAELILNGLPDKVDLIQLPGFDLIHTNQTDFLGGIAVQLHRPDAFISRVVPEHHQAILDFFAQVADLPEAANLAIQYQIETTRNQHAWIETRCLPVSTAATGRPDQVMLVHRDVTNYQQLHHQLLNNQEELSSVLEHLPVGIARLDKHLRYTYVNPALESFTGIPAANFIGKTEAQLDLPDELIARAQSSMEQALETGEIITVEFEFSRDSLITHLFQATILPEINHRQIVESLLVIVHRYSTVEKELRLFRSIIETSSEAIAVTDLAGRFVYVNPAHECLFEQSLERSLGQPARQFCAPESLATIEEHIPQSLQANGCWEGEVKARNTAGKEFLLWLRVDALQDTDPAKTLLIFLMHDITNQRRAEQQLNLLSTGLLAAANGVVITDRNGVIEWVNPAFGELTGFTRHEAVGKTPGDLIKSGAQDTTFYQRLWETILSGQVWSGELTNRRKTGELYIEEMTITPVVNPQGEITHFIAIKQDITQRKQIEQTEHDQRRLAEALRDTAEALASSLDYDQIYDRILENIERVVPFTASTLMLLDGDTARVVRQRGYERFGLVEWVSNLRLNGNKIARQIEDFNQFGAKIVSDTRREPLWIPFSETSWILSYASAPVRVNNQTVGFINLDHEQANFYTVEHGRRLQAFANQIALALDNSRLYQQALQATQRRDVLHQISQQVVASGLDIQQIFSALHHAVASLLPLDAILISLLDTERNQTELVYASVAGERVAGQRKAADTGLTGLVLATHRSHLIADMDEIKAGLNVAPVTGKLHIRGVIVAPISFNGELLGMLSVQSTAPGMYTQEDLHLLEMLAAYAAIALHNANLFEQSQRRVTELEAINALSAAVRSLPDQHQILQALLTQAAALIGSRDVAIWQVEPESHAFEFSLGTGWFTQQSSPLPLLTNGIVSQVFETAKPATTTHQAESTRQPASRLPMPVGSQAACLPVVNARGVQAVLVVCCQPGQNGHDPLDHSGLHLLSTLAEMAGSALLSLQLRNQTELQVQRLTALRAIDSAINASLDLDLTLKLFLDQVRNLLRVDATYVMLLDPRLNTLKCAASTGFYLPPNNTLTLRLGEGWSGRIALERKRLYQADLARSSYSPDRPQFIELERFVMFVGAPLIAKGRVVGTLGVLHRAALHLEHEWFDLLESLSHQAAIAIDNAALFNDLQQSNLELNLAYSTTLRGWGLALEMRDSETRGHTNRVTELSLRLGAELGMSSDELQYIQHGALLHDIGKIAIPDQILRKPGPLTDEEWVFMRQHPQLAAEMLAEIPYLQRALDIPLYHHEKWDGSGYPFGISAERIPLAARLFAVVDVWDALTSDRPYRPAWPVHKAAQYLTDQSGKHFDARMVSAFLKLPEITALLASA